MRIERLKRLGTILFYISGAVWVVYAVSKYLLGLHVGIRQFLPYHLAAVFPAILLKYCAGMMVRWHGGEKKSGNS